MATLESKSTDAQSLEQMFDAKHQAHLQGYLRWKGVQDRVLATILLVPAMPLIGALALLVRLTSRGPGIFQQERVGRSGKLYTMYKLRSMRSDAEAATGAVWSQKQDPRVTWLGKILRATHMDELPQLFNVIKGEMALVGPRPERAEFVYVLVEKIPGYMTRLEVLPGITGLSQINLPPDTDLLSVRRKQHLDVEYIQSLGWSLDLRIILCTSLRLVGISGFKAMQWMKLQRRIPEFVEAEGRGEQLELTPEQLAIAFEACEKALDEDASSTDELDREALRQTITFSVGNSLSDDQLTGVLNQLREHRDQQSPSVQSQ
ncbi:MAG: hypothetical protein CL681_12170 [Blastopirellula sp.]|nr:hypothetical protein [Blastopirellula sp.]